jgi:hypothetical protein
MAHSALISYSLRIACGSGVSDAERRILDSIVEQAQQLIRATLAGAVP